jgi:cyclic pyranopterin phosphate synthase
MITPTTAPITLHDRFGRTIDYLRISLTDRCNLRCAYCMPTEGLTFAPDDTLLSAAEIEAVVRAAAEQGFRKVRLTGGEPLLRADLLDIVARIAAVDGIADISLTTNGIRLPQLAAPLKAAGLRRVNVHIDSLRPDHLARLMRWGRLEDLWAGLEAAEAAGLTPIKINAVIARGYNDEDVVELAALSQDHPWTVRFIELMPLGSGQESRFAIDRYVPNHEVKARIEAALGPLMPLPNADASDESRNHQLAGAPGRVGFISPVSEPYCGTCNRMRLTADGKLHLCLLHDDELDLRAALRGGGPEDLAALLARAVAAKPTGHALDRGIHTEARRMHAIGG